MHAGGSPLQAFENQLSSRSQHGTPSALVRSSAKPNSGTKRKKRPRGPQAGNKDRRKLKLSDGNSEKMEPSANGDAEQAGNNGGPASGQVDSLQQTNGSSPLLTGSAEIPGIKEPPGSHANPSTV